MGSPVHVMAPPATQVENTPTERPWGNYGFVVFEDDGNKRAYVRNVGTTTWTPGTLVVNPAGAGSLVSSYGSVIAAGSINDQLPGAFIGAVPVGTTILPGQSGWVYTDGPLIFAAVATGGIAIPGQTGLTLRNGGLGVIPPGSTANQLAVSTAPIAANATTAIVDLRRTQ